MGKDIRVIVFKDGDLFVAQALELDIAAQGNTADQARRRLALTLHAEIAEAESAGRNVMDIGPAPQPFHVMFENNVVSRETMKAA